MRPRKIKLHKQSRTLELQFDDGQFELPAELLRVYSPSAEVTGHGPGQEVLQHGKREVAITKVEAAGNYALRLTFDDGHDSGIYTWDYLHDLATHQQERWQAYESKLAEAGKSRDPHESVVRIIDF